MRLRGHAFPPEENDTAPGREPSARPAAAPRADEPPPAWRARPPLESTTYSVVPGARAASEAPLTRDDIQTEFDAEESPTRESEVVVRAYARETEALIARGSHPEDAQVLVETTRPSAADAEAKWAEELDAVLRITVSDEELAWMPLCEITVSIIAELDGRSPLRAVLERASLSPAEAMPQIDMLLEMGLVALA